MLINSKNVDYIMQSLCKEYGIEKKNIKKICNTSIYKKLPFILNIFSSGLHIF